MWYKHFHFIQLMEIILKNYLILWSKRRKKLYRMFNLNKYNINWNKNQNKELINWLGKLCKDIEILLIIIYKVHQAQIFYNQWLTIKIIHTFIHIVQIIYNFIICHLNESLLIWFLKIIQYNDIKLNIFFYINNNILL